MTFKILLILGLTITITVSITKDKDVLLYCPSFNPQTDIEINLMMGPWFVVEVVHHNYRASNSYNQQRIIMNECPVVQLIKRDDSNFDVIWTEPKRTVRYNAKKNSQESGGYWIASGPHNDTIRDHYQEHKLFTGTIQVMKAVANHAVLTFCKSDHSDSHLFSAILSRNTWLSWNEIEGVNSMLRDRKLSIGLVKKTCGSSCSQSTLSPIAIFTMLMVKLLGLP